MAARNHAYLPAGVAPSRPAPAVTRRSKRVRSRREAGLRVALISDLHGNIRALDAVLADARRRGANRVVCLGDTATLGPRPREVLARLRTLEGPFIMGNHDDFLLDHDLIHQYTEAPIVVESVAWCQDVVTPSDLDFLRTFEATHAFDLDGTSVLFFHGSPTDHMHDMLATDPPDVVDAALGDAQGTVLVCGHTHLQMLRQHRGRLLVNPGSVGMPFREPPAGGAPVLMPHAEYGMLEGKDGAVSVSLHRVSFDTRAHLADLREVDHPLLRSFEESYATIGSGTT